MVLLIVELGQERLEHHRTIGLVRLEIQEELELEPSKPYFMFGHLTDKSLEIMDLFLTNGNCLHHLEKNICYLSLITYKNKIVNNFAFIYINIILVLYYNIKIK